MGTKKAIIVDGIRYSSIAEFMRKNKIPKTKRYSEIIKVIPCEIEKSYKVFGRQFSTLQEVADHYKVNYAQMRRAYYKNDLPLEYIINRQLKGFFVTKRVIKDHLGNEYNTLKDLCKAYNISRTTYDRRKEKGLSLKAILTAPKKRGVPCKI